MQREITEFLNSELAGKAFSGLAESARVGLTIAGMKYVFRRGGKNFILEEGASDSDIEFTMPEQSAQEILRSALLPDATLAGVGAKAFDLIFSPDPARKVQFQIHGSLFTLVRKGFFSVLIAGGPEILRHLGRYGFGNLNKIRAAMGQNKPPKE